jgi:hypothetical protein
MTIDLSEGGVQVEAASEVQTGSSVLMRIEFDTDKLPAIEASATVAWCAQQERGKYRVGLRFTSIDERSRKIISLYQDLLARRVDVDITTRTAVGDRNIELVESLDLVDSALPTLQVESWNQVPLSETVVLVGYMRAGSQLQIRLRGIGPGARYREYVFTGLRGLSDRMQGDPSAVEIAQFRYTSASDHQHRFQLLDCAHNLLLEIEAAACRESSPEAN